MKGRGKKTVAVVGTGMAGLTTAYLLHHDPENRYEVKLLEKENHLSLSSESIRLPSSNDETGKTLSWADVPMRAFAGGFYQQLINMYDYLDVRYHAQPFLFSFSKSSQKSTQLYMTYASNFHQMPWIPRKGLDLLLWLAEAAYALLCYLWFTVCCYLISPLEGSPSKRGESLGEYLHRIHMPEYHIKYYLLPLMSSVCTCSHQDMLNFPATDVLGYKRRTHLQPHFVVEDGVRSVQDKLSKGVDVQFGVSLTKVESRNDRVELTWTDSNGVAKTETFDLAVLGVSPDVAASVFEPVKSSLGQIPTCKVETVAHTDYSALPLYHPTEKHVVSSADSLTALIQSEKIAQGIHLWTRDGNTEAAHEQPCGIIVTTNPLKSIDVAKTIRSAKFTRVLRTLQSRNIINNIFSKDRTSRSGLTSGWTNGQGGVYLVGGWCWDGMVLLEGCIVSAMRVASSLGVQIPWEQGKKKMAM
ncbi:conserved hypothetical protein [Paecilomyces variotii No. 5]|uniref:Amine oxidase domain-containing protein n=1 Tax=Byssochlamys spectabilis (strain No. 5 / NBRC 109023) TaxID=1356009 RepID=V5GDV2_BYSSN|nr:conserved hypothetical protein [Paecilomyces variotii No. 5]